MTTVSLDAVRVFQVVAQEQSFTRAAQKLRLDKSHVSRTVRALEAQMGLALLVRSTRSVKPTAEGEALLAKIAPHIAEIEGAVATTPEKANTPSGEVVVTTTPDLGRALLAPSLVRFRARFPAVRARVLLSYEMVDLMRDGVDLALRIGRPGADALIARKLCDLSAGFFAAPAYLQRRSTPRAVEDLAHHDGLWPIPPKGQRSFAALSPRPPAIECADFTLLADCARAGGGIAMLPLVLAAADLATGALVRVLPELSLGGAPLYLVSRPLKPLPARVQALRSFLLEDARA